MLLSFRLLFSERMSVSENTLTGIVRYIGSSVEQFVDAMATVAPDHRETMSLRMFLNDVPQFTIAYTRLH